jgi:hypothetical protein
MRQSAALAPDWKRFAIGAFDAADLVAGARANGLPVTAGICLQISFLLNLTIKGGKFFEEFLGILGCRGLIARALPRISADRRTYRSASRRPGQASRLCHPRHPLHEAQGTGFCSRRHSNVAAFCHEIFLKGDFTAMRVFKREPDPKSAN